jgi:hypothetical protein
MKNYERIGKVFNDAWIDGDIRSGKLFTLQIQLLRERLNNKTGYSYTDEEIRLAWKSFYLSKYPHEIKRDRGFSEIVITENE